MEVDADGLRGESAEIKSPEKEGDSGRTATEIVAMVSCRGNEGTSWENVEKYGKRAIFTWNVGVFHSQKGRSKKDSGGCFAGKEEGIQEQLQQESLFREVLEQVRGNVDMGCGAQMMRIGNIAIRDGSWEEFKEGCKEQEKSS